MTEVWFITGVSSGFGLEIALNALQRGHRVIGTVRDRQRAASEVSRIEGAGGTCLGLDVTNADACWDVWATAEKIHGHIDVLVNNAGMAWLGAVEDFTDEEARAQMDVNFYGPLRLIRAALPGFRKRRTGAIVNVTSVAGITGIPSCSMYAASKFALEGFSETLAGELKEHNISVLLVEPGAFRTKFLGAFKVTAASSVQHYSAAKMGIERMSSWQGKQPGDPAKAAAVIVDTVDGQGTAGHLKGKLFRLPLGPDCVKRYEAKVKSMSDDLATAREVALSTDIDE